jgi:hypothetical protein
MRCARYDIDENFVSEGLDAAIRSGKRSGLTQFDFQAQGLADASFEQTESCAGVQSRRNFNLVLAGSQKHGDHNGIGWPCVLVGL